MKVGFVGLGKMGTGMARNLLRAGHQVTVYNRSRAKADALTSDGAQVADSAAAAAKGAQAVFTMLSDDDAVEVMVWGDQGFGSALENNAVHISSSTISAAFSRNLESEHRRRRQQYVAAPVFGRPDAAENKKLVVVAAGDAEVLKRLDPLFEAIGRRTFLAGSEPWYANAIKICGNFMIASMLETFSEAFAALAKAGVEPRQFLDVMNELFGSPVYKNYGANIVGKKFDAENGFALKLGFKDGRLALELAQDVSAPMPFASVMRDRFLDAMAHGQEDMDWSSLSLVSARNAGLQS